MQAVVVVDDGWCGLGGVDEYGVGVGGVFLAAARCLFGADQVDQPAIADTDEPASRLIGDPLARPALDGDEGCFLYGVFGEFEPAEPPYQRAEHVVESPIVV